MTALPQSPADAVRLPRPQAVGALPLPAGYLLLADTEPGTEEIRRELVDGRLPEQWPPSLDPVRLALSGDTAAALAAIAGDSPLDRVNRFVLEGRPEQFEELQREDLGTEVAGHVELVGFSLGLTDRCPDPSVVDGELAAMAFAAQAAAATESHQHDAAVAALQAGVEAARPVSVALTAQLLGALAEARMAAGEQPTMLLGVYDEAINLYAKTDLAVGQAEMHLARALLLHGVAGDNHGTLLAAVEGYQAALGLISKELAPELFAVLHANLASAYLTMPMTKASDKLRVGVAVQSLRHALDIFTPDTHAERWASAQLNLANALVYMPSGKQGDNLVEAVELYEAVLQARDPDTDPMGYARVAANQGNALAHLGIFGQAKGRLHEARFIFEEHGDIDSVATVRSVLDQIAKETSAQSRNTVTNHAIPSDTTAVPGQDVTRYPTKEV